MQFKGSLHRGPAASELQGSLDQAGRPTADGGHEVCAINAEDIPQLAEGSRAVVLPAKVARGVRWRVAAAVPGKVLPPLQASTAHG